MDKLAEEFSIYQLMDHEAIPQDVWTKAKVSEDGHHRMDIIWQHLSKLEAPDDTLLLPRLSKVAALLLVIPNSNAQEERVFSMVRKIKIAFRPTWTTKARSPAS